MDEREKIIEKRLTRFKKNKYLQDYDFDKPLSAEEHYQEIITILEGRAKQVRQQYVSKVFYGTSVSQNGFIDAIIILSAGINLTREIFTIYNGRVSNKDMLRIGRKIYTAMAIGGSEGVEYATDEIITSFAYDGIKSIPFIDKIMGSLADGFVSSMLITRISFIAENYCKIIYLPNDRALVPPQKVIYDTTNSITSDVRQRIKMVLRNLSADKSDVYTKLAVNPAAYVIKTAINKFGKQLDSRTKSSVSGALRMASHPVGFVMDKVITRFRKKKSMMPQ
ncbi:MAG: DUF697 domain-containing protein [Caldithrix sp.]|nr:DUF697 domain-containing protein [Caldithrix sp.]